MFTEQDRYIALAFGLLQEVYMIGSQFSFMAFYEITVLRCNNNNELCNKLREGSKKRSGFGGMWHLISTTSLLPSHVRCTHTHTHTQSLPRKVCTNLQTKQQRKKTTKKMKSSNVFNVFVRIKKMLVKRQAEKGAYLATG